ncbi:MAG: Gfo/Idh/MocA family oxidoreductase [Verrucomicrobiota bacterium]
MPTPPNALTRRAFTQTLAASAATFAILPGRARAQAATANPAPGKARMKFAVIGANHDHIFRMTQAVRAGGGELAMIYAPEPDPQHGARFLRENASVPIAREEREVLERPDISLVVTAAIPVDRVPIGLRVLQAGKDFITDKGAFTTMESVAEARRVQAATKRMFSISYNERLLEPATVRAGELVHSGAIGRVLHTTGFGPHGLFGHGPREPWFWTRAARGGILCDIATHQADQFLFFTGSTSAEVVDAEVANRQNPDHPEFEDYGTVLWRGNKGTGYTQVDYTREASLGMRLHIVGTEGTIDVIKGRGTVVIADKKGRREEQVPRDFVCPFGRQLVDDVINRTETAMTQAHAFLASELAVRAQVFALQRRRR